jgi:tRNA 2-thiocytidine biosynthesis protein TtcA
MLKAKDWRPYNKLLFSRMRKASRDYGLIEDGDRIVVGLSGGKDSTLMLYALAVLQRSLPVHFDLRAVTLDMGWGNDYSEHIAFCQKLDVPFEVIPSDVGPLIFEERQEKNPCSLCARMRRGAVNGWAHEHGCNKVALGHHLDDVIETLLMSMFYEGRVQTFMPKSYLSRSDVTVIRPMVYVTEADIISIGKKIGIPVMVNKCPADGHTVREDAKDLIKELSTTNPMIRTRLMSGVVKDLWKDALVVQEDH